MKKKTYSIAGIFLLASIACQKLHAQTLFNSDSAYKAGAPNSGQLWGYVFGDYYYKGKADSLNRGNNQYSGIPQNRNAFQIRRAYLGYNYNISNKISTELLLAAENGATSGDALTDNKLAFFVKLANIRIKNVWNGTDFVIGQIATPAFSNSSEKIWGYRSIERTITDWRGTPSYDLGVSLQGKIDPKNANFGYDLMAANGTGAKYENDNYKWFYADLWGYFLDKKIYANIYADYNQLSPVMGEKHSRNMLKGFLAYMTPGFTAGVEAYINNLKNDDQATEITSGQVDLLDVRAKGITLFARGTILKDKLGYFARYDATNPDNKIDNSKYNKYVGNTSGYNDPSTKEQFITAGLDFTPAKNVHLMPNVWINSYKNQGYTPKYNTSDIVYRVTFYYTFGK